MSVETPENPFGSIVERAKAIILKPKEQWPVIEREYISSGDLFTRYAVPLAAIGPVAQFIGGQLFGYGGSFMGWGFSLKPSFMGGLTQAIVSFALSLVGIFVLSFIANKLAPNFGGESSSRNAFKLVVYSMTASWLAGIFGLIPSLGWLAIVGLYSFYLFYTGVGPLMKVPAEKAMTYTIVTVICVILVYLVIGAVTGAVRRALGIGPSLIASEHVSDADEATVSIPGIGAINSAKLEQAAKDLEHSTSGNNKAIPPASLQALLPGAIGSYQRTKIESEGAGPGSQAEGTYEAGDRSFDLKVTDMALVGAMASLGASFGVESNKEDADGYERTTTKNGALVVEKWDRSSNDGHYMTVVDKRYMIEAEGEAASIDELKAAVASIDQNKLIALGKTTG